MKSNNASIDNNAVVYARYSSHNQTEQSIEGQLRVCHEYAKREGYVIVGEYIDRALTGRYDGRPDFQRMISDSVKKGFRFIIVYKLDRFARNRYDSATYKYKLRQNGVKVISAMECIGDNPESIILEAVLEASAEYYSVDLSQKITRGMKESVLKGQYVGGGVPIGYKAVNKQLVIDEQAAPVVQWAFKAYASGTPKKEIVDELNARGIKNKNGKPYGYTALQSALRNKKYLGILRWKDIECETGIPALIDSVTFDQVQVRLDLNRKTGAANGALVEYLLSRKVFCGYCGSRVVGDSGKSRNGNVFYYYVCADRKKSQSCKKNNEKKDFLEWFVVEQTVEYVLAPHRIHHIAAAVVAQYDREFNHDSVRALERRISRLDKDIAKYTDAALEMPRHSREKLYEKIEDAGTMKDDLEVDLAKLRIANGIRFTEEEIVTWLMQFCKGDLFDMEFRKRIIDVFINSVIFYDDKIVVFYNIKGGKQVSHIELIDAVEASEMETSEPESGSDIKFGGGA